MGPPRSILPPLLLLLAAGIGTAFVVQGTGCHRMRRAAEATVPAGDVDLAVELLVPRDVDPPWPAVVVVHGSGPETRSTMRDWARRLTPMGLAVALYDKRGTGDSTGTLPAIPVGESAVILERLAGDAAAVHAWVRERPDVDPDRVGFVGVSQAGWIMPLAAERAVGVRCIVAVSGPAVSYGEEVLYSRLTGDDPGPEAPLDDDDAIAARLEAFTGPRGYDPRDRLAALDVPMLWILGGADRSVPTARSVAVLDAIRAAGGDVHEVRLYPRGDHGLRDVDTGRRIDYDAAVEAWLVERGMLVRQPPNSTSVK